jgi:hypothetical protein
MSSTSATKKTKSVTPLQDEAVLDTQLTDYAGTEPAASLHDQIALLAYAYWEERGCPSGSAEEDWLRAEQEISGSSRRPAGFQD